VISFCEYGKVDPKPSDSIRAGGSLGRIQRLVASQEGLVAINHNQEETFSSSQQKSIYTNLSVQESLLYERNSP
jgi:hypothetical protein